MARTRTGTVVYVEPTKRRPGHYKVRVTCRDGSRPWIHLDPSPKSPRHEARARKQAVAYSERFAREGIVAAKPRRKRSAAAGPPETVSQYVERWLADRTARKLSSVQSDRGRLKRHVLPIIGPRAIVDVTREDIREVVEHLDAKTASGDFSWRTAHKVWGNVTKLFADARDSKTATLRVRTDNPAKGVRGPDRGALKAKQWLFPTEATALLACDDVPLRWRRLYALAIYLYTRPGELAALDWSAVHLDQGFVHVHRTLDLRTGNTKPTKTKLTRRIPIPLPLRPLLETLQARCGKGLVLQNTHPNKTAEHGFPPLEDLAANLRDHLERAGVRRADLYDDNETTKRITFYDLRATGITWEALAGTDPLRIMQRAGHLNFSTTQGYIREAEAIGQSAGEPFPALPASLVSPLQSSRESSTRDDSFRRQANQPRFAASPTGFEPVLQP